MKFCAVLLLLAAVHSTAYAQEKGKTLTLEETATIMVEKLDKDVSLTAEQKDKVFHAALENMQQRDALSEKGQRDLKATAAERKSIEETYQQKVIEILTPEQQKLLEETIEKRNRQSIAELQKMIEDEKNNSK